MMKRALFIVLLCFCANVAPSVCSGQPGNKIEDAVYDYVVTKDPLFKDKKVVIKILSCSKDIEKYSGMQDIIFAVPSDFKINKITHKFIVPVLAFRGNRAVSAMTVTGVLEIYADVVVAKQNIKKNQKLTAENLELAKMDVSQFNNTNYYASIDKLAGKLARHHVASGSPLFSSFVSDEPDVIKRESIKLVSRVENVYIEVNGISLDDGRIGDTIKTRRGNCKETILAKVIGKGIAEVK